MSERKLRKTKCHKCGRYMVQVFENHQECTSPDCDYYYSYDFDIPEGVELPPEEEMRGV
jgi:hypothetical protein